MSSGKLVIKDHEETIVLRARHILIDDGGELHAGSALCPYQGNFSIVLYGRWAHGLRGALGSDGKEAFHRGEGEGDRMARLSCEVGITLIDGHRATMSRTDVSGRGEPGQSTGGLSLVGRVHA